ncbi:MAG TPA: hypothetical protein VFC78_03615 [Tepidisphaeraceae bacterium]|nr:hypothetical protein [Tepidisphaeraceae bacterium]
MLPFGNTTSDLMFRQQWDGHYYKLADVRDQPRRIQVADSKGIWLGCAVPFIDSFNASVPSSGKNLIAYTRHGATSWSDPRGPNVLFFDSHVEALTPLQAAYALDDPTNY